MKIYKSIHQGDVLFLKVGEFPENLSECKELPSNKEQGLVIQHGEALGHYHRVEFPQVANLKAYDLGERDSIREMALVVEGDTLVVHEEHDPVTLDKGLWRARTQRETVRGITQRVLD